MKVKRNSAALDRLDQWLAALVDSGKLPQVEVGIDDAAAEVHHFRHGVARIADRLPLTDAPLYRIFSMTKPIVSLAILRLFERGALQLDQPVADFIPAFAASRVVTDAQDRALPSRPNPTPLTLHHLLTHSSGLIYGQFEDDALGRAYRERKLDFTAGSLAEQCDRLAALPLAFEPGSRWQYGVSTDVLGRVLEVATGRSLDQALQQLIFTPLGMEDTFFAVPQAKAHRLVSLYNRVSSGALVEIDPAGADSKWLLDSPVRCLSGGAGLVSSLSDYRRFARMLVAEGRLPDGERLLAPATLRFARQNHLPGSIAEFGVARFSEMPMTGVGFGLGFGVIERPPLARMLTSPGDFGWGGYASTVFWVDPLLQQSVVFMTQQIPSGALPIRPVLRTLVAATREE